MHEFMEPSWAVRGFADANSAYLRTGLPVAACALRLGMKQLGTVRIRPDFPCTCANQNRTGVFSFHTGLKRQQTRLHTAEERQAAPIPADTLTGGLVKAAAPPSSSKG